ncbi:MAG: ankyrin repeat domain-containing protein [Pirellulales bacterium]
MLPDFALIEAIKRGSIDELNAAIAKGAGPRTARDVNGLSALAVAAKYECNEIARKLIEMGFYTGERFGKRGNTLLHRACSNGNYGFVRILLQSCVSPNVLNQLGQSPIHLAVQSNHEYMVQTLLEHRATPHLVANNGDTPLHIAARGGYVNMIKLLIQARHPVSVRNRRGLTPLQESLKSGHIEYFRY